MPSSHPEPTREEWAATADAAAVTQLRRQLMKAASQVMSADDAHDLGIAASEVLGNVVRHAYGGRAGACRLSFACEAQTAVVVIEDDGLGFEPSACSQLGPIEYADAESGRGLQLARHLVDALVCGPGSHGGARVEMRLHLS